ncbi:phytoene/squalene synthase family protein [Deinococcus lacus]|uniref:Phytoene/squalene synthase family protein n=1 Tax=Deinococcus lacus TaxID=392561 RepID=A0ABW1YEK5_9DEIO
MLQTSPPTHALLWCRAITRQHSHTFYRGSLLYPPGQREAVWAVYAACRVGDDIADSGLPPQQAQAELAQWWKQIEAAYAGEPGSADMQVALAWAVARYPVPLEAFAELYQGFLMDLCGYEYRTISDLTLYCRRVAGVVGYMVAPIGGYRGGASTLQAALLLGQAMQLTNILRDVGEDLRLGRLYLPAELLSEYGVAAADLRAGRMSAEYRALLQHLESLARQWYDQGASGIPLLEGRARYGVAVAARLYAGILDELAARDYDNLRHRAFVSDRRKLALTLLEVHAQSPYARWCPLTRAEKRWPRRRVRPG